MFLCPCDLMAAETGGPFVISPGVGVGFEPIWQDSSKIFQYFLSHKFAFPSKCLVEDVPKWWPSLG